MNELPQANGMVRGEIPFGPSFYEFDTIANTFVLCRFSLRVLNSWRVYSVAISGRPEYELYISSWRFALLLN
jgi:hypothetical protein